jgi:hypothetical protein
MADIVAESSYSRIMPAKINLTDDAIRTALVSTKGLIAAAAQILGISSKTLSRRLASNPEMRPAPATDPVWERALAGDAAIRAACADAGIEPFAEISERLGWVEDELEEEPTQLFGEELVQLVYRMKMEIIDAGALMNPDE